MRRLLTLLMTVAMIVASTGIVEAAGLTQAGDTAQVQYSVLSDEDIRLIESIFDYEYYKSNNPDLVAILGEDYAALFQHFINCGIFEGRCCNAGFEPSAYASAYPDLKEQFGDNIIKYYEHYLKLGIAESRNITTIGACADAGITVESLVDNNVKITPAVYYLAAQIGTDDYKMVQNALNSAVAYATGGSSGSSSSSSAGAVIISSTEIDSITAEAKGLTKVGTLTFSPLESIKVYDGYFGLSIYSGDVGYAAKYSDDGTSLYVYKTADYVENDSYAIAWIAVNATAPWDTETDGKVTFDFSGIVHSPSTTADGDSIGYVLMKNAKGTEQEEKYYKNEYHYTSVYDSAGNKNSEYNIGLDIKENGDGNYIDINLGVYNDDTGFAAITNATIITNLNNNAGEENEATSGGEAEESTDAADDDADNDADNEGNE